MLQELQGWPGVAALAVVTLAKLLELLIKRRRARRRNRPKGR